MSYFQCVSSVMPDCSNYCLCLGLGRRPPPAGNSLPGIGMLPPPAAEVSQAVGDFRRQQHKSPGWWQTTAASSTSFPGSGRLPPPAAQVSRAVAAYRRQQHKFPTQWETSAASSRSFPGHGETSAASSSIIEIASIWPYRTFQANACVCGVSVHVISCPKIWHSKCLGISLLGHLGKM